MSLDVYLEVPKPVERLTCIHCNSEYDGPNTDCVFEANITHNLGQMADAAGIYKACWRPEEIGATKAKDILKPLLDGLASLETFPEKFKQFDAKNGWGTYEQFVPWVRRYAEACAEYPEAIIRVSR